MKSLGKRFAALLAMCVCVSCSSLNVNKQGLKEFLSYQLQRELESIGKKQLKEDFDEDYTMSYDEYQDTKKQIDTSTSFPKRELLRIEDLYITNKGRLKFKLKGQREIGGYDYGLFKTDNRPVQISTSISIHGLKFNIEIEDINFTVKTNRDGEIHYMVFWKLRF